MIEPLERTPITGNDNNELDVLLDNNGAATEALEEKPRRRIRKCSANTSLRTDTTRSDPGDHIRFIVPSQRLGRRASTPELSTQHSTSHKLRLRIFDAEENIKAVISQLELEKGAREKLQEENAQLKMQLESVGTQTGALATELAETRVQLKDTRAHIMSLQPFLKDITPEEVGRDFDDLHTKVCDWVEKWLTPVFDDAERSAEVIHRLERNILRSSHIKKMMAQEPDLARCSVFPDTNQDVAVAMIMRFLYREVLSTVLCNTEPAVLDVLKKIEDAMRKNVQPQRDVFTVRNWRAETFNSLIHHGEFVTSQYRCCQRLSTELAAYFAFFDPSSKLNMLSSLENEIIRPAMLLQQKIQTSIHHFYFELSVYEFDSHAMAQLPRSALLLHELDKVECEDVLNNRKKIDITKVSPPPSREEALEHMYPICVTSPRLMMRQVGRGNVIRDPTIVRKQKVLVAWGPHELRAAMVRDEPQTLMNAIQNARKRTKTGDYGMTFGWGA
ncbi:hypothetical protein BX600DRAFT_431217 [Xylariales sp. PMI_506]|nr:hypothetical protein BX600DRAFT_431217 [Xylariales sp. PMI_506]